MKERVFFEEFDSLYYFHGSTQSWAMQGFHFHKQYEIILFLSDGALLEIGNRSYNVRAGDVFLLNNKEYHRTSGAVGKPHNRYVLMFDPEEYLSGCSEIFQYEFDAFFEHRPENFVHRLHLSEENLKNVEKLFLNIEREINDEEKKEQVKLRLAILNLIVELSEMYRFFLKEQKGITNENKVQDTVFKDPILNRNRIEQIKKYIVEHVNEKLELDDIAKEFYMNRYYLSHYFKKETGFTLQQYITNRKVVEAKGKLKSGYSVTEIAAQLSYNSDSHFIATFKKSTGITPKKYAQEKKNSNNE
jgi:AraC-like DNA-binding protein